MHNSVMWADRKDRLESRVRRYNMGILSHFWSDEKSYRKAVKEEEKHYWKPDDDPIDRLELACERYIFMGA